MCSGVSFSLLIQHTCQQESLTSNRPAQLWPNTSILKPKKTNGLTQPNQYHKKPDWKTKTSCWQTEYRFIHIRRDAVPSDTARHRNAMHPVWMCRNVVTHSIIHHIQCEWTFRAHQTDSLHCYCWPPQCASWGVRPAQRADCERCQWAVHRLKMTDPQQQQSAVLPLQATTITHTSSHTSTCTIIIRDVKIRFFWYLIIETKKSIFSIIKF